VAKPYIWVPGQPVLKTPLGPKHLFSGKGPVIRRKGAGDRTTGALKTLLEGLPSLGFYFFDELEIRLHQKGLVHLRYLLKSLVRVGSNLLDGFEELVDNPG
jgi:hypothetical protein